MLNKDHKSVSVQIALALLLIAGVYRTAQAAATLLVPDNYPTIQAAINAASPGDTIMVRAGTYSESLALNKYVILTAETFDKSDPTHNTTIIDSGASNLVTTIDIPAAVSPMPTIRGFVIRNGNDGIRAMSEFIAEYNYFLQSGDLIDYSEGSGGINRHNIYFNSTDDSIDLDDMNRSLLIEDNRMMYSGDDGIEMRLQDSSAPVQPIEVTIRNNEIIGSDEDGIQFIDYSQPLDTNRRIVVTGNLIANSRFAGIGLMPNANTKENYSDADIVEAIRVYGNTLYGNNYGISGGDNLMAFNNIIANSTTKGVWKVQGTAGSNSVVAYSLFHNNGMDANQSSLGAGSLFGQNPLFSAQPNPGLDGLWRTVDDDFSGLSLQAASPAIDAGVVQYIANSGEFVPPAPITGFSGPVPDLGWKEFNSGSIRFAVIGDYGSAGQAELDVANLVKSWNPDFIITTGDNNYPSGAAKTIDTNIGQYYHEFIHPYSGSYGSGASTNRFFPSLGNHDWITTNAQPYLNYFTLPGNERYYDFVWGSAHFFAIDSDSKEPDGNSSDSTQAQWLQTQLAASTSPWNLVYMHHAPYSSSSNHGSTTIMQWPYQTWGASTVLAGHDHTYERILQNGFPYFVNGLGGSSIYSFGTPVAGSQARYNADYGAMLVDANEWQITFQFIARTGVVIDSHTLNKPFTPTPTPITPTPIPTTPTPASSLVVNTITRADPNPTSSNSVDFIVAFSNPVTGVDSGDFALTTTGSVSGATVSGVVGSGNIYTVTVNTGTGNGTIRLDVPVSATITDLLGNPLSGLPYTSGQSYTIIAAIFADVPYSHWAWQYIERLYNAGITSGCSVTPLMYCPDNTVTRAQMAVFLLKGIHGSSYAPPAVGASTGFTDVPTDYWAAAWIKQLAAEGITSGCGAGIYCPDATVTRAQMAIFLLRAKHGSSYSPPAATGVFTDVPIGYWVAAWIEQLAAEGITGGCGVGIYCPENAVTRAQMAVFLVRTFNLP